MTEADKVVEMRGSGPVVSDKGGAVQQSINALRSPASSDSGGQTRESAFDLLPSRSRKVVERDVQAEADRLDALVREQTEAADDQSGLLFKHLLTLTETFERADGSLDEPAVERWLGSRKVHGNSRNWWARFPKAFATKITSNALIHKRGMVLSGMRICGVRSANVLDALQMPECVGRKGEFRKGLEKYLVIHKAEEAKKRALERHTAEQGFIPEEPERGADPHLSTPLVVDEFVSREQALAWRGRLFRVQRTREVGDKLFLIAVARIAAPSTDTLDQDSEGGKRERDEGRLNSPTGSADCRASEARTRAAARRMTRQAKHDAKVRERWAHALDALAPHEREVAQILKPPEIGS